MPDPNNVLFSSEYDDSGMKSGVNSTLNQLEQLQKNVDDARISVKKYNTELKTSEDNLKGVTTKLSLYNSLSAKNKDAIAAQTAEVDKAQKNHAALSQRLADANLVVQRNTRDLHNYEKQLNATNREHQLLHRATEKFTSLNHLAAEGINHVRRQVVDFGLGLAGGFVSVILSEAIPALLKFIDASNEASGKQKIFGEVMTQANKSLAPDLATLEIYRKKLDDLSIPQKERIRIAKEYNAISDEGNKIDLKQIDNLDLINAKIQAQINLLRERAIAKAGENIVSEKAEKLLNAQLNQQQRLTDFDKAHPEYSSQVLVKKLKETEDQIKAVSGGGKKFDVSELLAFYDLPEDQLKSVIEKNNRLALLGDTKVKAILKTQGEQIKIIQDHRNGLKAGGGAGLSVAQDIVDEAQKDFDTTLTTVAGLITTAGLTTDPGKGKAGHAIENVFQQKLLELRERLAKIAASVFKDEDLIRKQFAAELFKEDGEIDKLLKEKKLTGPQAITLKDIIGKINQGELNKSLGEFLQQVKEAGQRISDEIQGVQLDASAQRITNLRDQFEREQLLIEQEYTKTVDLIQKKQREAFKKIDDDVKKGLVSDNDAVASQLILGKFFGDLITEAGVARTNKQLDLSMKIFENTIKEAQTTLGNDILNLTEETTQQITLLTTRYLSGKISYEKYQKQLTKITQRESKIRRDEQLAELEQELKLINAKLLATQDPELNKTLLDQQEKVRNQISALQREDAGAQAAETQKKKDEQISSLLKYVNAVGDLTNSVIGFWQKVNEVEEKQIERSIALQEKRVTAAQRIADRGNAEYLRQEEDRLTQLQIKQENAAKKQLAVNAVLTASQALVAFISAIAQGAKLGGALGAIVDAAAIISLLGTGYSIVKSLQTNAPKLFRGSKSVQRNGEPAGRDTIYAWLNEGEAVIPTDTNKAYKPAVEAIYDKAIPPEILNQFVLSYPRVKTPQLNYAMIGESAEMKINSDGRLVGLLSIQNQQSRETIEVMRSVDRRLKNFGVDVKMDKNGFAMSILQAADQIKKSSKA